ncbi:hypothetical protein CK203_020707 [Vitis vinifera]|uniref:Transmembrane protein 45B n=1 Tax=Vitis vinifera TaxID=29760 RepID=A0A438FMU0_VITVI|nr:hypothetical protein CK203_020707 [Vitis vinifera]
MGTFVGHLVPGLALTLLGLWHTINTIRAYALKGSTNFTVKFWYPFNSPFPNLNLCFWSRTFLAPFHSTDHVGLEGHYHWLLQLIVLVSLVAALAATSFPTSFPAALVLSTAVVFQGCWFMNMGFMLWVPEFVPKGCKVQLTFSSDSMHGAVACGSHDADLRARALANMHSKAGSIEYEQLHSGVPNVPIAIDGFKEAQT